MSTTEKTQLQEEIDLLTDKALIVENEYLTLYESTLEDSTKKALLQIQVKKMDEGREKTLTRLKIECLSVKLQGITEILETLKRTKTAFLETHAVRELKRRNSQ